MATTVHEPPKVDLRRQREPGNGGWRNLVPADGDPRVVQDYSPPPASTGIWVVVYAITMTFAALTSALIVRKGASLDWQSFTLPSILYLNTALLLGSSVTLEIARRRVATFMGGVAIPGESPARWLYITLGLGLLFVTGQYVAWSRLRAEGLYLATNPSSSFFYLLTAAHVAARAGRPGRIGLRDPQSSRSPNCGGARWMQRRATGTSWTCSGCICCCCFG